MLWAWTIHTEFHRYTLATRSILSTRRMENLMPSCLGGRRANHRILAASQYRVLGKIYGR
jgi:hypothetical protein